MAQCGENMCLCSYSFRFPAFPNLEQRLGNPAFLWKLEKEPAFRNIRAKVSSLESDCQDGFRLLVLRFSFGQGSTLKPWPLLLAWDPVLTLHKNTIWVTKHSTAQHSTVRCYWGLVWSDGFPAIRGPVSEGSFQVNLTSRLIITSHDVLHYPNSKSLGRLAMQTTESGILRPWVIVQVRRKGGVTCRKSPTFR